MVRHEKTCTMETRFKFKEQEYGCPYSTRSELEELAVLTPDFEIKYVSYDIETISNVERVDDVDYTALLPISIGYYDGSHGNVYVGEKIVEKFLAKMAQIQV